MGSQMYIDLMVAELMSESKKEGQVDAFRFPMLGTLAGGTVLIDSIPQPVPLSQFQFLVDDRTTIKPQYTSGDRLLIVPIGDGGHWVIVGRLI